MKKTPLILVCAVVLACGAQAQEMRVIRTDDQVDTFDLADIDSVTFAADASGSVLSLLTALGGTGDVLCVHTAAGVSRFALATVDSMCFAGDSLLTIHQAEGGESAFALATIDSLTFASSGTGTVGIVFAGTTATVTNPLADLGVTVAVSGADVTVTAAAGLAGIAYVLSGATADGMFKIYSDSDFDLVLDGVQITNGDGPAINIQAGGEISVELAAGTTSTLADGADYADPPGDEDQKAAFFSEGELDFSGSGSLVVQGQGSGKHGLGSDDFIVVDGGTITVAGADKDGIHTNAGYYQLAGTVDVTSGSDGVDAGDGPIGIGGGSLTVLSQDDDRDAVKCDGTLMITGGTVSLTVEGDQSKGLNAVDIQLTGGTLDITTSGGAVLEESGLGYDPSYCTAIKADAQVVLDGCQVSVVTSGLAGRGISCDGDIVVTSGNLSVQSSGGGGAYIDETGTADAYTGPCLKANGDIVLDGGTVTLVHSGSGGKGISGDGDFTVGAGGTSPVLGITTTGTEIAIGGGEYAEAKAVSIDSVVTIHGGSLTIASADDAIKSKYWLEVNGGSIDITGCVEGLESPNLFINGGEVRVNSTDDGLNATQGNDVEGDDGSILTIAGGYVVLYAPQGDGIDSNGSLTVSGGTVIVHGPPMDPDVGIDVNGTFLTNGGLLAVAQINSMMDEVPGSASTQRSALLRTNQVIVAGTLIHIEDTAGNAVVTFRPAHNYSSVLFSSTGLVAGTSYRVYTGGTCTGTEEDGLFSGGTYSGGTLRTTFTSSTVAQIVYF